jgi:hypothetical protein
LDVVVVTVGAGHLPGLHGDALDITARFRITEEAREREGGGGLLGLLLRCVDIEGPGFREAADGKRACVVVSYNVTTQSMCAGWAVAAGSAAGGGGGGGGGGNASGSFDFNALENKRCVTADILPMGKKNDDGGGGEAATAAAAAHSVLELRVFLDRSIIELYANGAALTQRCLLPDGVDLQAPTNASADVFFYTEPSPGRGASGGADAFAPHYLGGSGGSDGGEPSGVHLVSLEAWRMGTMWGAVS